MAYTLGNKYAKNLCKRMVLLQLIIENVVTCFFLEHSVRTRLFRRRLYSIGYCVQIKYFESYEVGLGL